MRLTYVRGAQCPHPHTQILEGRPRRPLVGRFLVIWSLVVFCDGGLLVFGVTFIYLFVCRDPSEDPSSTHDEPTAPRDGDPTGKRPEGHACLTRHDTLLDRHTMGH